MVNNLSDGRVNLFKSTISRYNNEYHIAITYDVYVYDPRNIDINFFLDIINNGHYQIYSICNFDITIIDSHIFTSYPPISLYCMDKYFISKCNSIYHAYFPLQPIIERSINHIIFNHPINYKLTALFYNTANTNPYHMLQSVAEEWGKEDYQFIFFDDHFEDEKFDEIESNLIISNLNSKDLIKLIEYLYDKDSSFSYTIYSMESFPISQLTMVNKDKIIDNVFIYSTYIPNLEQTDDLVKEENRIFKSFFEDQNEYISSEFEFFYSHLHWTIDFHYKINNLNNEKFSPKQVNKSFVTPNGYKKQYKNHLLSTTVYFAKYNGQLDSDIHLISSYIIDESSFLQTHVTDNYLPCNYLLHNTIFGENNYIVILFAIDLSIDERKYNCLTLISIIESINENVKIFFCVVDSALLLFPKSCRVSYGHDIIFIAFIHCLLQFTNYDYIFFG